MEQIVEKIHGFTDAKEIYDAAGFNNGDIIVRDVSLFPDAAGINIKTDHISFESGSGVTISDYVVISVMQYEGDWITPRDVMASGNRNVLVPSVRLIDHGGTNDGISVTFYSQYATGSVRIRVVLLRIANRG